MLQLQWGVKPLKREGFSKRTLRVSLREWTSKTAPNMMAVRKKRWLEKPSWVKRSQSRVDAMASLQAIVLCNLRICIQFPSQSASPIRMMASKEVDLRQIRLELHPARLKIVLLDNAS